MPKLSAIEHSPPLIELFEVNGLNGFKNLRLETPTCVRIVVAENGTGKTTLLNMLYAILSKRFSKLFPIKFDSLTIQFSGYEPFHLNRTDVFRSEVKPSSSSALSEIYSYGVSESEFNQFAAEAPIEYDSDYVRDSAIFQTIYRHGPHDVSDTLMLIRKAMPSVEGSKQLSNFITYITRALGPIEVLYLPTFRRIEVEDSRFKKRARHERNPFASDDLFGTNKDEPDDDNLIWFGMGDVEAQLELIRERIRSETFSAYSRLSVQSLEDLLSPVNKHPDPIPQNNEILLSQLRLVLARIGQADTKSGAKIWELIGNGKINDPEYDNLRTYLFQMLEIYTSTQKDEQSIEGFVKVINNYWNKSAQETNTQVEKSFIFDKTNLGIDIKTPYSPTPLSLGNLSSGEKQIVSVFAKLHLQKDRQFIVLIDEPELSLSMTWQQLFLPDILESPSCAQLIAITHSPFVFENMLDSYAQPLFVTYNKV
ncbi:Predicted ATP-binding protein involved in virulence [Pseudomonas guariconensis]|uniref:AAA family ATPase n=1 Tax=Pseudomonas guariconensis TaxID=1288410 RepID=UPI00088F3212|nr:AAA family ATPase [Pseudomonas guariconensis]SDE24592.1 Predicted ATP-binding protein involved in virulence [Pseudomonas guariconensis]